MTEQNTILIAGAGIGGLTLGIALANKGIKSKIFEKNSEPTEIGAGIQLSPNAVRILSDLNLADDIKKIGCIPKQGSIKSASGQVEFTFEMGSKFVEKYDFPYIQIYRPHLLQLLTQAAISLGVDINYTREIEDFEPNANCITALTKNESHKGRLLIGCDGIRSKVREKLFADLPPPSFTHHIAWRATLSEDDSRGIIKHGETSLWLGPKKHAVVYPVARGKLLNFVAIEESPEWVDESWNIEGNPDDLRKHFAGWDKQLAKHLKKIDRCNIWGLFDRPILENWSKDNVILIGDAAHPILPFMAQGAAMAIEDSWALADVLARNLVNDPTMLTRAVHQFEKKRKKRVRRIKAISDNNAKLYHHDRWPDLLKRRLQFRTASLIPSLFYARLNSIYGYKTPAQ